MKSLARCATAASCILLVGIVVQPTSAEARATGAYAGRPTSGTTYPCFTESGFGVVNNGASQNSEAFAQACPDTTGSLGWEVGLDIDGTGTKNVSFGGLGTPGSFTPDITTGCMAFSYDGQQDQIQWTAWVYVDGQEEQSTLKAYPLQSIHVYSTDNDPGPYVGHLYLECIIGPQAEIAGVNWNP